MLLGNQQRAIVRETTTACVGRTLLSFALDLAFHRLHFYCASSARIRRPSSVALTLRPLGDEADVARSALRSLATVHCRNASPGSSQLTLDTFDGQCWVGVVPFHMSGIHARGLPPLPGLSHFPELNVRTYVTHSGKPGVYFFSLDAANLPAVWAARAFYRLPYFHAEMSSNEVEGSIHYSSRRYPRSRRISGAVSSDRRNSAFAKKDRSNTGSPSATVSTPCTTSQSCGARSIISHGHCRMRRRSSKPSPSLQLPESNSPRAHCLCSLPAGWKFSSGRCALPARNQRRV